MMELASSLVVGAKTDFIDLIYNFVVFIFQVTFSTWTSDSLHVLFCLWPNNSGLKILLWIFDIQATDVTGHCEAYHTLSRILQVWIHFLAHLNYHPLKLLLCRLSSFCFFFWCRNTHGFVLLGLWSWLTYYLAWNLLMMLQLLKIDLLVSIFS